MSKNGILFKIKRRLIIIDLFNEELYDVKNFIFVMLVFGIHILPIYTLNNPVSYISKTNEYYEANGQLNHVQGGGMNYVPAKDVNGRVHSYVRCIDTGWLDLIRLGTFADKFCPQCEKKLLNKKFRSQTFLKCKKCRQHLLHTNGGIVKCTLNELETKGVNEYVISQLTQSMGILFYLGTVYTPIIILIANIRSILEDRLKRDGVINYLLMCFNKSELETILELYGGIYMLFLPLMYLSSAKNVYKRFILNNVKNILGVNLYSTTFAVNPVLLQLAGANNVSPLYAIAQVLTIVYFENTMSRIKQINYIPLIKKGGYCILGLIFYTGYKNNLEIIAIYNREIYNGYFSSTPYGQFEYMQAYSRLQKQLTYKKAIIHVLRYKYKQNYLIMYILSMTLLYMLGKNKLFIEDI